MARLGLLVPDEGDILDEVQNALTGESEYPGFIKRTTPEGYTYFEPDPNYVAPRAEEIPIPPISLPDAPKPDVPPPTVYDVTAPEPVPETPHEQLEKLKPPVDVEEELKKLALPEPPPLDPELIAPPRERPKLEPLPPEPEPPEPEPPPPPKKLTPSDVLGNLTKGILGIREAMEPERQMVAKPLAGLTALPWMIPAGTEAIRGLQHYDEAERATSKARASWLLEQAAGAYRGTHKLLGAEMEPRTWPEYLAGLGASSYIPGSKLATLSMAAVQAAVHGAEGKPFLKEAVPPMDPQLANWLLTTEAEAGPATTGPGQTAWPTSPVPAGVPTPPAKGEKPAKAPKGPQPGIPWIAPDPKVKGEKAVKEPKPPPSPFIEGTTILKRPVVPRPRKSDKPGEYEARVADFLQRKEAWLKEFTPTATQVVTITGEMKEVKESDLYGAGIVAVTTTGMLALPWVYRGFKAVAFPKAPNAGEVKVRPVPFGPEGLVTGIRPTDILRANVDDINLRTVALAERAMIAPEKVEKLETLLRTSSFSQGQAQINSAMQIGQMRTVTMDFQAPTGLPQLRAAIDRTPYAKEFLITRDILEVITMKENIARSRGNMTTEELAKELSKVLPEAEVEFFSAKGPPIVNGLTKEEALDMAQAYVKMSPDVVKIGKMWDEWNLSIRRTQVDGEAATIRKGSRKDDMTRADVRNMAWLNSQRVSEVPFQGTRSLGMSFQDRVSHTNIVDALDHRSRIALKERMFNEIRLTTIDSFNSTGKKYFHQITQIEKEAHPEWEPYIVEVYRRGEKEYWAADRMMKQFMYYDPYVPSQGLSGYMHVAKRGIEHIYTGNLNPMFSIKNAFRVWHGAKINNADPNLANPSVWGMAKSVPEQLYPKMGKWLADTIEDGGGKRLTQFYGALTGKDAGQSRAAIESLGRWGAQLWDESTYAMIERAGGSRGSTFSAQQLEAQLAGELRRADEVFGKAGGKAKVFWDAYKAGLGSVHEAPIYDFVSKNMHHVRNGRISLSELIAKGRDLGGDPRIMGTPYVMKPIPGGGLKPETLKFESDSKLLNAAAHAAQGAAFIPEIVRAGPWGNAIIQSVKRVGTAYIDDPIGFTGRMWMASILPAGVEYMWNHVAGMDPNGKLYTDYGVDGRTRYATLTNRYFAVPGRPAEDGIQLPWIALEYGLPHAWTQRAMHMVFGTNKLDPRDDMEQALWGALDISVNVPLNMPLALWETYKGRVPAMSVFGGETIQFRKDPYDQYRGMPESIERYLRMLGPLGDAAGRAWAAYSHTEEGFLKGLQNAASEAPKPFQRQVPFNEILFPDARSKYPGTNKIMEKVYENQDVIDRISNYYKREIMNRGDIYIKPKSEKGGEIITQQLGPPIPGRTPGPPQPAPNNQLFNEAMEMMYGFFKRDNPGYDSQGQDLGGVGYLTLLGRRGQATSALRSMGRVDDGLHTTWQRWMNAPEQAEVKDELVRNRVDPTNPRQVRNFYEDKRQEAGLLIYYYQRAAEEMLSKKYGKEIKLKNLEPYNMFMPGGGAVAPPITED